MSQLRELYNLYNKYNSICNFIIIYIEEAHAENEWKLPWNIDKNVNIMQHKTISDKINACKQMINIWKDEINEMKEIIESGKFKIVCDDIDCGIEKIFNALPERIIILNKDGTIAVKEYGPLGFNTKVVDQFLFQK